VSNISGANILVSGGAGFVGSNLVKKLLQQDAARVHVIDNLMSAEQANLPASERLVFSKCSIADDQLLNNLRDEYDYVFHLATYHGNQSSIHDPIADHDNNTITSLKLFNKLKDFKRIKKVVYSGAGCAVAEKTFGEAEATEESDLVKIDGDSPYSLSKLFGEFYAKYFHKQYGLPVVRARFQNVYGPGEILGAGQWRGTPATVFRNVTPTFIWKALKGQALTVENEGIATRDFIFVDDIVEGLIALALRGVAPEAYNLATGTETPIIELANEINRLTENPTPIQFLPKRAWDNSGKRFGSTTKSERELGFKAQISLAEGLKKTVAWTKENRSLIQSCMLKHKSEFQRLGLQLEE
jgi:UDP-glucose 4-epimerase